MVELLLEEEKLEQGLERKSKETWIDYRLELPLEVTIQKKDQKPCEMTKAIRNCTLQVHKIDTFTCTAARRRT